MAEQLREIEAIAGNPAAPTLENTLVPLEKSGQLLNRAATVFFNLVGTDTNDTRNKLRNDYAPKFAAHNDAIYLNGALFKRIETLFAQRETAGFDAESKRLVQRYHEDFVRSGARLSETDKAKLKQMNAEAATLGSQFNQAVLDEVNASAVTVENVAELDGLTPAQVTAAAEEAKSRGLAGKYVLTLLNTTGQPLNSQLTNRALRQRLHEASVARGSRGGAHDTRAMISRVMQLRAESAKLLGYPTHAAYGIEDQTARTPEAVNAMLRQLAPAAVANARREAAELQTLIDAEGGKFQLAAWDWSFYSEKLRVAKYAFDESQLKPYLELQNVLENGVFFAANQLYGISFNRRTDLPLYHPDTWIYDVTDADGKPLAIFIADMYARPSKRGGAWMNSYVSQARLMDRKPVVANHLNITKPPAGEPTLLTWDEVVTTFHEFGHALHGMFSDVTYPYFSGTSVPRDFVEYPSQTNEMWADWPAVLKNYAKHHKTGEPMPQALLDKVVAAAKFNTRALRPPNTSPPPCWTSAGTRSPQPRCPPPTRSWTSKPRPSRPRAWTSHRCRRAIARPTSSHIMGGYSAGYYAYIWSEVLDANAVEWFRKNGGMTRANGDHYRKSLLSRGGSVDAMTLFRGFTGSDPVIGPLLEKRGLK